MLRWCFSKRLSSLSRRRNFCSTPNTLLRGLTDRDNQTALLAKVNQYVDFTWPFPVSFEIPKGFREQNLEKLSIFLTQQRVEILLEVANSVAPQRVEKSGIVLSGPHGII